MACFIYALLLLICDAAAFSMSWINGIAVSGVGAGTSFTYVVTIGTSVTQNGISAGSLATNNVVTTGGVTSITSTYTNGLSTLCTTRSGGTYSRSTTVYIYCGASISMASAVEPSKCVYIVTLLMPQLCYGYSLPTPSRTLTATATHTQTPTMSSSMISTPLSSQSLSPTRTASVSASMSTSSAPSVTRSETPTPTGACTSSALSSADPTVSPYPSGSMLPTTEATSSFTSSPTGSPSLSSSLTNSATSSYSSSPTVSATHTVEQSVSATITPVSSSLFSFCNISDPEAYPFPCTGCPPLLSVSNTTTLRSLANNSGWLPADTSCRLISHALKHTSDCTLPPGWAVPGTICESNCVSIASQSWQAVPWGVTSMVCDASGEWVPQASAPDPTSYPFVDCDYVEDPYPLPAPVCANVTLEPPVIASTSVCNTTLRLAWSQQSPVIPSPPYYNDTGADAWISVNTLGRQQGDYLHALQSASVSFSAVLHAVLEGRVLATWSDTRAITRPALGLLDGDGLGTTVDLWNAYTRLCEQLGASCALIISTTRDGMVSLSLAPNTSGITVHVYVSGELNTKTDAALGAESSPIAFDWFELARAGRTSDCFPVDQTILTVLSGGNLPQDVNPYIPSSKLLIVGDALPSAAVSLTMRTNDVYAGSDVSVTCAIEPASSANVIVTPGHMTFHASGAFPQMRQLVVSSSFASMLRPVSSVDILHLACNATSGTDAKQVDSRQLLGASGLHELPAFKVISTHALWPFFSDVILELPGNVLKSAWSGMDDTVTLLQPLWNMSASDRYAALLSAHRRSDASSNMPVFVSSETNLTLVVDDIQRLNVRVGFAPGIQVSIGGIPCPISWISDDRKFLRVTSPPFATVCADPKADCGVTNISLSNPTISLAELQQLAASTSYVSDLDLQRINVGAAISCPPFCPGLGGKLIPSTFAVINFNASAGAFVPSLITRAGVGSAPTTGGLMYISACTGYPDPTSGACSNASSPLAGSCAWGSADACRPCSSISRGVLCPGGYRVWPLPSYFVAAETSVHVLECPAPSTRCMGWRSDMRAVECAVGYQQGSRQCAMCAKGYYPVIGGECVSCPGGNLTWLIVRATLFVFGGLAAVCLFSFIAIWIAMKRAGGTMAGGAKRIAKFFIAAISCMQAVVQVSQTASPGLPANLQSIYSFLAVFQLKFDFLAPACIDGFGGVFRTIVIQFIVTGVLVLALLVVYGDVFIGRPCCSACSCAPQRVKAKVLYVLRRSVIPVCALVYALVCNATLNVIYCNQEEMTVSWYLKHVMDGTTISHLPPVPPGIDSTNCDYEFYECDAIQNVLSTVITVPVLVANPYVVCYESQHKFMVAGAAVVFVCFILFFPIYTWLLVSVKYYQAGVASSRTAVRSRNKITLASMRLASGIAPVPVTALVPGFITAAAAMTNQCPSPPKLAPVEVSTPELQPRQHAKVARVLSDQSLQQGNEEQRDTAPLMNASRSKLAEVLQVGRTTSSPGGKRTSKSLMQRFSALVVRRKSYHLPGFRVDDFESFKTDPSIMYFTSNDYRPSRWYFRHLDLLVLFLLSCVGVYMPYPSTLLAVVLKCVLQCTILVACVAAILLYKPFSPSERWLSAVRVYTLIFGAFASIMSLIVDVVRLTDGVAAISTSEPVAVFSYIVFIMSIGMAAVVVAAFWWGLLANLTQEQAQIDLAQHVALKSSDQSLKSSSLNKLLMGVSHANLTQTSPEPTSPLRRVSVARRSMRMSMPASSAPQPQHNDFVNPLLIPSPRKSAVVPSVQPVHEPDKNAGTPSDVVKYIAKESEEERRRSRSARGSNVGVATVQAQPTAVRRRAQQHDAHTANSAAVNATLAAYASSFGRPNGPSERHSGARSTTSQGRSRLSTTSTNMYN